MMAGQPVRAAVIGLGFGAEFIPICQRHPQAEMAAICSHPHLVHEFVSASSNSVSPSRTPAARPTGRAWASARTSPRSRAVSSCACPSSPWGTKEAGRSMEPSAMDVEVRPAVGETLRSSANFEVATVRQ
jgi:hypothetical protein